MRRTFPTSATLCSAFIGTRRLASGPAGEVALAVKAAIARGETQSILIFDDATGGGVDFDLRGSPQDILARLAGAEDIAREDEAAPRGRGRPKLGVVAREVTFMWAIVGNLPGYEEAARALYVRDKDRFFAQSEAWPKDLRDHARSLAAQAFDDVMQ
jgi:uncharacterized protein